MGPHAAQTRGGVLKLGKLDLQLGLARPRPKCENVENQLAAVDHLALDGSLEPADLTRGQIIVKDHDVGLATLHALDQLLKSALTQSVGRRKADALLHHRVHDFSSGRPG